MRKPSWLPSIVAACAVGVPLLLPVLYLVGYLALSKTIIAEPPSETKYRFYRSEWQATIYRPAGQAESALTSVPVHVVCDDDSFD